MKNWQKYQNYRIHENPDGSLTYIITVDGQDVEVSEEIYRMYATTRRKMKYMELDLKRDRYLRDGSGRTVRDENGNPVMIPEREVSLEKIIFEGWDCPSPAPSLEDEIINSYESEIKELRRCAALLPDDERALVHALFYEGKTIREYADITGKSKSSVVRDKARILGKLKNLFKI